MTKVLVVRAEEYAQRVSSSPFTALPREELERLYASIDVLAVDAADAAHSPEYLQMVSYTALHYNYAWLTHQRRLWALGIEGAISSNGEQPLFLDNALQSAAQREVYGKVGPQTLGDWRLSGLVRGDQRLGLVYVVKLRQPGTRDHMLGGAPVLFRGNTELVSKRAEFEPWSQLLIDDIFAL